MDPYGVYELPASICATEDARPDRCVKVTRKAGQGVTGRGLEENAVTVPSAPVLPDPDVIRLQRVLEDVRFSLERGYWQAALAAARAALTHDEVTKSIRGRLPRLAA
jgi:hypothetical protein